MALLEWVRSIATSRFVLTNSFSGAVFAVLSKRPFASVGLPGGKVG
jgi:hypothetical protein